MTLKELFEDIPQCLREIFIRRFILAAVSLIAGIVGGIVGGFLIAFPLLGVAGFFLVTGVGMLWNCLDGQYVIVNGTCKNIEHTSVRGRIKAIYVAAENGEDVLCLQPKEGAKKFNIGDPLVVYVPAKALTVKMDGIHYVQEYYCMMLAPKEKT